jgi:TldD protein
MAAGLAIPYAKSLTIGQIGNRAAAVIPTAGISFTDPTQVTTLRDPRMKALAHAALDAARTAGARYADVRMTQTLSRSISDTGEPTQHVALGLNVRALVHGYWGWAATPVLSTDEAVRVARRATEFALRSATLVPGANVELDASPVIAGGDWSTPVKIDPFTLDLVDLQDWMYGMSHHLNDVRIAHGAPASVAWALSGDTCYVNFGAVFEKQERLFASTEGTLLTQTTILTTPNLRFPYAKGTSPLPLPTLLPFPTFNTPIQAGWERIAETPLASLMEQAMDRADAEPPPPPTKLLNIGRYDVVFSASAMAQLLNTTLGAATHFDSAIGEEAYAGYISYLGPDPLKFLGTQIASPLVNITAERSNPTGLATARWDEEGVATRDFPLVTQGVLENYQTTRAQAARLAPWYQKQGRPVQSLGCAMAPSALEETMQHTPNLVLQPGRGSETEASLVADLEYGIHVTAVQPPLRTNNRPAGYGMILDWQYSHGYVTPLAAIEIRHGKPASATPFPNALAIMFRTDELWKNIQVLGGANSLEYAGGFTSSKGDPVQHTQHSIGAVPARIKQLTVVDTARMA